MGNGDASFYVHSMTMRLQPLSATHATDINPGAFDFLHNERMFHAIATQSKGFQSFKKKDPGLE
jgi:hypothetical protein